MQKTSLVRIESIERRIFVIRDQKVLFDFHLAQLYGVRTKALLQAVKRNPTRFPDDFAFQLTKEEHDSLRSQIVTSKRGRGGRRFLPYAFTEEGVAMLSSVLRSERAIRMNVAIMRAFVKLRRFLSTHKELAQKLKELEQRVEKHDTRLLTIFQVIRQMMKPPEKSRRRIGFRVEENKVSYQTAREPRQTGRS